jgi:hypothetical protein
MRKATITHPDKSTVRAPSGLFLVFVKNVLLTFKKKMFVKATNKIIAQTCNFKLYKLSIYSRVWYKLYFKIFFILTHQNNPEHINKNLR